MYSLGIDFGGGACKATLPRQDGIVVATATTEYQTFYGEHGKAEQNPTDWFNATINNIKSIFCQSKITADEIKCVCFDAATHTAVLMDADGQVLCNSIYWTDTRCTKQKEFLEKSFGNDIFNRFYHKVDTIWTLPQLLYLKETNPDLFCKIKKITFAKDYVRGLFTGDFVTDYIEAQGSMFYDYTTKSWSKKYLDILGLGVENLPRIVNPLSHVGGVNKKASEITGLKEGTPVICGSTDTAMEVFSAGAINKGQMTIKLATAGRICLITDSIFPDQNLVSYSHLKEDLYYPGTATKSCASALRWFRDTFGGDFESFNDEIKDIPIGSNGLIFHPYLNGELTPYANPKLRGSFVGVSANHTKAHFIRSVMEGVALSLKDCKNYLSSKGYELPNKAFIIGGGAKSKIWRQIIADCLGVEVITTKNNDSSFGSSILASIYANFFDNFDDAIMRCQEVTGSTLPNPNNAKIYDEMFVKYKKIQTVLSDIYND